MHSKCGGLHGHHGPLSFPRLALVPVFVWVFFDRMQRNHTKKVAKLRVAYRYLSTLVGAVYSKFNNECIVKIKNVNSYLNALIF